MYLLVTQVEGNYGGDYEDTREFGTLGEVVDYVDDLSSYSQFYALYEIKQELSLEDLDEVREARVVFENEVRAAALAKLTPQERKVLGL